MGEGEAGDLGSGVWVERWGRVPGGGLLGEGRCAVCSAPCHYQACHTVASTSTDNMNFWLLLANYKKCPQTSK